MKRVIQYMSSGAEVAYLFPNVVRNVATKNMELKKLVYHFLVHYAELEPEASLLSINSFQKDLSDSNPVIRALALRVLSSIRLPVIVQIVVLSIQKCLQDSSPYVRKAAAHAVMKVYSMDQEQKDTLREFIATLLNERSVASLGSAVAAWNEVCPDEFDMLHQHYRKICIMVVDSDEWSQVHMINALTRYARAHFRNPNSPKDDDERLRKQRRQGWESGDEGDGLDAEEEPEEEETLDSMPDMDADHRLLLSALSPLLNSRNDQVVLAVVSAHFYCAPAAEAQRSGRALVRILRSAPEVQFVVLTAIVTMAAKRPSMFSQHVSEFFVRGSDPTYVAKLKLEVLTHIADSINIHTILEEFNYNTTRDDKLLVAASVQAIGRVAANLPKVTDDCMSRLLAFLSNSSQIVLAESVIVIKKLLQLFPGKYTDALEQLARSLEKTTDARARASIVWAIGEYAESIPVYAPDILRKLCISFASEVPEVKLQALNLGVKLHYLNPAQTETLFRYLLELASFDLNYDVRDKARLMNAVLSSTGFVGAESQSLFMAVKPLPKFLDPSEGRQRYTLGSLSHVLNSQLSLFLPLPHFAEEVDEEARAIRVADGFASSLSAVGEQRIPDQWNEDEWNNDTSEDGDSWEDEEEEEEATGSEKGSDEWSSSPRSDALSSVADPSFVSTPDFDSLFSGAGGSNFMSPPSTPVMGGSQASQANMLDNIFGGGGAASAEPSTPEQGVAAGATEDEGFNDSPNSNYVPVDSIMFYPPSPKRVAMAEADETGGLLIECSFPRRTSAMGEKYSTVEISITNEAETPVQGITISDTKGVDMHPFPQIAEIAPGTTVTVDVSIHFASASEPVQFQMGTDDRHFEVKVSPVVGELLRPVVLAVDAFEEETGRIGASANFTLPAESSEKKEEESAEQSAAGDELVDEEKSLTAKLIDCVNVFRIKGTDRLLFCGVLGVDTRVYIEVNDDKSGGVVKCGDDQAFATLLADHLTESVK